MKRLGFCVFFGTAGLLSSVGAAGEMPPLTAHVNPNGQLVATTFDLGLAAYLPGWERQGDTCDFSETRAPSCRWQLSGKGRPLWDAAFSWQTSTDGSLHCTLTATCRVPTELQCLGLMLKIPAADVAGSSWSADAKTRVFPEEVNDAGGFGGGQARRFCGTSTPIRGAPTPTNPGCPCSRS